MPTVVRIHYLPLCDVSGRGDPEITHTRQAKFTPTRQSTDSVTVLGQPAWAIANSPATPTA